MLGDDGVGRIEQKATKETEGGFVWGGVSP